MNNNRKLIPVPKWPEFHPWPSIGGLRNMVFNSKKTGFDKCVFRVGDKVLIDEQKFFEWVDEQNKKEQ